MKKNNHWLRFFWSKLTVPAFMVFFIISFFVSSHSLSKTSTQYPYFLLIVLSLLVLVILIREFRADARERGAEEGGTAEEESSGGFAGACKRIWAKWYKQIGFVFISLLYIVFIYYVGYYVSTFLFAFALARLLKVRPVPALAVAAWITAVTFLMLPFWLKVSMPAGLLI